MKESQDAQAQWKGVHLDGKKRIPKETSPANAFIFASQPPEW
jgi:hypothetical protein